MENASKALIIAGAVLLAILLIGVGMLVFNAANKPISESTGQMDEQTVKMFNSKFTPYIGTNISGSSVKTLLDTVVTSNGANPSNTVKVTSTGGLATATYNTSSKKTTITNIDKIIDANKYTVTVTEYDPNGRIVTINIAG